MGTTCNPHFDSADTMSCTRREPGCAICRDLAQLIGATVSLASQPGAGSTFFVDVPLTYREKELQPLIEE